MEKDDDKDRNKNVFVALYASTFNANVTHLGNTELGVYFRMILWYYVHERALPGSLDAVNRIAIASTPEEQRIVVLILEQFFEPTQERSKSGGLVSVWRHRRCEREIAEAHARTAGLTRRGRKAAIDRWDRERQQRSLPGIDPLPGGPAPPVDNYACASVKHCLTDAIDSYSQKGLSILGAPQERGGDADPASPLRRQGIESPTERLAAHVLSLGVKISPRDPLLAKWIEAGYGEVELTAAVRYSKRFVKRPQPVSALYVDRVLHSPDWRACLP